MKKIILIMFLFSISLITAVNIENSNEEPGINIVTAQDKIDANTFLELSDTPFSYLGNNGKCVIVNETTGSLVFDNCNNTINTYWENFGNDLYTTNLNYNVGIGTDSPSEKLDVDGNITLNNNNLNDVSKILFSNGDSIVGNNSILITIGNQTRLLLGENDSIFAGDVKNVDDLDGLSRFSETNLNNGTNAIAAFTATNNIGEFLWAGITGGGFNVSNPGLGQGQGGLFLGSNSSMGFSIGYNKGFLWRNDPTNSGKHRNTTNILMILDENGSLNVNNNITLGEKLIFKFGQMIDNIIDGWLRITGNLNVTGNITGNYYIGEMWFEDEGTKETVIISSNTWANITGFDMDDNNGFTRINDSLICNYTGRYFSSYQLAYEDGIGNEYNFGIAVNNIIQNRTISHSIRNNAIDVALSSGIGGIRCNEGDIITLQARNMQTSSNAKLHHASVYLKWNGF